VIPSIYIASALVEGVQQVLPKLEAQVQTAMNPPAEVFAVPPLEDVPPAPAGWKERTKSFVRHQADRYDIDLKKAVLQGAQRLAGLVTREAGALLQNIAGTFFTILVTLLLMAVLFKESARLMGVFRMFIRLPEADKDEAIGRLRRGGSRSAHTSLPRQRPRE
jgi:predicted PurR-regulated permease PerM